jgi:hypothetical protein
MGIKMIDSEESKSIRKVLKKYSKVDVASYNENLRGSFVIKNYRKYKFHEEVDVEFNGEIFAKLNESPNSEWLNSSIYNKETISKVKVNRFIRRFLFNEVRDYCRYFGVDIKFLTDIKKINWT